MYINVEEKVPTSVLQSYGEMAFLMLFNALL
jgi:hypothetical protein